MPTELLFRGKPNLWPGQRVAHLLAMMAAVGVVALARQLVALSKRLDPEL